MLDVSVTTSVSGAVEIGSSAEGTRAQSTTRPTTTTIDAPTMMAERRSPMSFHPTCHVPHLLLDTGALKTTEGKAEVPSLDKEGWLRPLRKCREASVAGADGVVGSSHRLSEVERTTPVLMFRPTGLTLRAAPPKERDHCT